ncbi:hypothetical protein N7492_010356 [Penicillium capsulatum]|uniref:Uncharacterized protein n=1 Tax=Penicillium capsulatum TaxID=69766 RepID=A0A9W9LDT7_9EURO|nr:hypothetical protein N7492_010356 [Penicillium capsulatum]
MTCPPGPSGFLITVTEDSPEENEDIIERLIQDWALEEYDPSTELALLSILVSLAYNFERQHFAFAPRQRSKTAQFCLERADACASLIRENSPDLITSRPFLQWRLAKERLERHWGSPPRSADFRENEKLGLDPWGIPISTRKRSRGVVWPPVNPRFPPNDVLHAILRVSRENGDCRLEEECLSEMICRSDSPGPLLDQLGELQLSNGNNIGHLTTCLSKSLLVTDDSSVKRLIRELKQAGSLLCAPPEQDIRLHLRYAESVINGNLHEQLPGSENDVERYWDLSWRIHDTMESIRTRGAEPEPNPYSDSDETDDGQIETRVYRSRSRKDAELSAKVAKTKRKIARLEKQLETHRTSQGRTADTTSWNHRREGSTAGRADRETLKPQDNEHGPRPPSISRRRSRTRLRFRDRGEKDKGDKKERFEIVDPTDEKEEKSTPRVRRTSPSPESYRSVSDRRRATDKKSLDDEGIVIRRSGSFTRQRPAIEDFQGKQPVDGESEIPTEHPPVYQQEDSDVEPPAEPSAMPPSAEVGDELGDDNGKRVIEDDDSDFSETDM